MSNRSFIFNERILAEYLYKNGFTSETFNEREAVLVGKYFRFVLGYKDAKTKTFLKEFCESHDPFFYYEANIDFFKRILRKSKKDFIVKTDIIITKGELDKIRTVKNFLAQKMYLGMLAVAKRGYTYVPLTAWKDIKKIMNIKKTNAEIYKQIHLLYTLGFLVPSESTEYEASHKILVIYENSEPVFDIKSDRELYMLGQMYKDYCGGELEYCIVCGKEFVKRGKTDRFCDEHALEKKLENSRNRFKKHYQKESNAS